jgi:hypothetical protein
MNDTFHRIRWNIRSRKMVVHLNWLVLVRELHGMSGLKERAVGG